MRAALRVVVVLLFVASISVGCVGPSAAQPDPVHWKEDTTQGPAPELARFNELLADLAQRMKPGLVLVRVTRTPTKDDTGEVHERPRSTGSGFIIDDAGLIVTNAHVVEDARSISVHLFDGRHFPGKLIGKDNRVDLALIKIDGATHLAALPVGDSNKLRVGEFVMALGHPFGLEQSVSFGIVSRKGAPLTVAAPGFDFIQTDAAINPGNSGGPLVNMAGEVVGVNSMAARNGSIGFAIPSNLVKLLVPQLALKGHVDWGWLGVSIAEITDDDAARLNLKEPRGVLIRSVMPGEPADVGGVKPNDVVLAAGGTPLESPRDLQRVVSTAPVGTKMRLLLLRAGQEHEVTVTIGRYKDSTEDTESK